MPDLNAGELVRHPQLGVGRVSKVSADSATVAFRRGTASECAADELVRLASDGFWQAVYTDRDDVLRRLSESPAQIIALLLRDMPGNEAHVDAIANELAEFVPSWDAWWRQAQGALAKHVAIDSSSSGEGVYALAGKASASVEDLYDRFRTLPRLKPASQGEASINPGRIEAARSAMVAASRTKIVRPELREDLKRFILDVCRDDRVPVRDQVDLLMRGGDLGWLANDELGPVLQKLCTRPIPIYDLGRFAQKRIIGAILEHVGFEAGRRSLLTAFAAEQHLIRQAREACLTQGQTMVLLDGLRIGLTENLLDEATIRDAKNLSVLRHWYTSFGSRIEGLSEVLESIVFDTDVQIDPADLSRHLGGIVGHLNRLAAREEPPAHTIDRLVGFWRRAMAFAPPGEQEEYLSIPSLGPMHAAIAVPILQAVFRLDPSLHSADAFISRIMDRDWHYLRSVLEHLVREHWAWDSDVDALLYLCDRLPARDDALDWITGWAVTAIREQQSRLLELLPVLDRLSSLRRGTNEQVQGLRQRAIRQVCHAVRQGEKPRCVPSRFDDVVLAGLSDFIHEVDSIGQQELDAQQARTKEVLQELSTTKNELKRSEMALEELRRGYRQPDHELRFAERRRVLEMFTATVAEIERFATVQQSRELLGVARRLNSLLQSLGVTPYGTIGETMAFDPARHELVGESDSLSASITVIERGYTIQGLDGEPQILKPARVAATSGGQTQ